MIASLEGTIGLVTLARVVIVAGGVGHLVHTTPATAAGLRGAPSGMLHTTLVVREDSMTLYGFATPAERDLFETVQTVSGVGPRLALAMLAVYEPGVLVNAIQAGDLVALTRIPGVGKKSAERIVLELRDKILTVDLGDQAVEPVTPREEPEAASEERRQVSDALVGLGWSAKQADDAVSSVLAGQDEVPEVAVLLRLALRELGR